MENEKENSSQNDIQEIDEKEETTQKEKKKVSKWVVAIIIILVSLLVIFAILVFSAVIYIKTNFKYNYNEITSNPEELGFEEVIEEKNINIALFGIDSREKGSFSGRSDSIMILNVNTKTNQIKLISVMRDTMVPIQRKNRTSYIKLNSAYATGGPEYAIKTLNTTFGLDISEYATVNFEGMADIIDQVGGIEAEITKNEINYINVAIEEQVTKYGGNPEDYKLSEAGYIHLNGIQAVAYSRIRYVANSEGVANDYGRTDRQRYVLNQLFNKVKSLEKENYVELIKSMLPHCETSLSYTEILDIALGVMLESPTLLETRIPDTTYTMKAPSTNLGSIVYYDLNFAAKLIHGFIYDGIKPEDYIAANGVEKNDWYTNGYTSPVFEKR